MGLEVVAVSLEYWSEVSVKMYALFMSGCSSFRKFAMATPSASEPWPIEPPVWPTMAGFATFGEEAQSAMPEDLGLHGGLKGGEREVEVAGRDDHDRALVDQLPGVRAPLAAGPTWCRAT